MNFFSGYSFFVALVILMIPAIILGLKEKSLSWYRWMLSVFFIWQVYSHNISQLLYLIAYVLFSTYLVKIYLILRNKYGRNKYIYGHAIFMAILPLVIYKVGSIQGYSLFGFLGISYICFRVVQVIIESYDGVISELNELEFIQFLVFFPSLSSGPIDRSRRFSEDYNRIWTKQEYLDLLYHGLYKIVLGGVV